MPYISGSQSDNSPAATVWEDSVYVAFLERETNEIFLAWAAPGPHLHEFWRMEQVTHESIDIRSTHSPTLSSWSGRLWLAFQEVNSENIRLISRSGRQGLLIHPETETWSDHGIIATSATNPIMANYVIVNRGEAQDNTIYIRNLSDFMQGHPNDLKRTLELPPKCQTQKPPAVSFWASSYDEHINENVFVAFLDDDKIMVTSCEWASTHALSISTDDAWSDPVEISDTIREAPVLAMHIDDMILVYIHPDETIHIATLAGKNANWYASNSVPDVRTNLPPALVSYRRRLYVIYRDSDTHRIAYTIIPGAMLHNGVDFSSIGWAQTVEEANTRYSNRALAVMRYWSDRPLTEWVASPVPDQADWSNDEKWDKQWNLWVPSIENIYICIAKMWCAENDADLTSEEKNDLRQDVVNYITSDGFLPSSIGTFEKDFYKIGIGGENYNFTLRSLIRFVYLFRRDSSFSGECWRKLGQMLNTDGDDLETKLITEKGLEKMITDAITDPSSNIDTGFMGPFTAIMSLILGPFSGLVTLAEIRDNIEGDFDETENHILSAETSRYLTNQLISSGTHSFAFPDRNSADTRYNNYDNARYLKRYMRKIVSRDFIEYNSLTYAGMSLIALINLYDFAEDSEMKLATQIALDFISAHFATQSFDLKRSVGFCRAGADRYKIQQDLWADPLAAFYAVLIGNYAGLDERYDGIWRWRKELMLPAASTEYRIPDLIVDLAIDKGKNPYELRVNHAKSGYVSEFGSPYTKHIHTKNVEIITARRNYLLTAGGRYSKSDYWWRESEFVASEVVDYDQTVLEKHDAWSRPTVLIFRGCQRVYEPDYNYVPSEFHPPYTGDYLIYSPTIEKMEIDHKAQNNTGIFANFATGSPFDIPQRYRGMTVHGPNNLKLLHLREEGLYVAINERHNVLEVMCDSGLYTGGEFHDHVTRQWEMPQPPGECTYMTIGGRRLISDASVRPGRWPILNIDGVRPIDYHEWPFIDCLEGVTEQKEPLQRVFWADGFGRAIINNPAMNRSLILSVIDPYHPIRIEQGCAAYELIRFAKMNASSNEGDLENVRDGKMETYWEVIEEGVAEASIDITFIDEDTGDDIEVDIRFISLRAPRMSKQHSTIKSVTIKNKVDEDEYETIVEEVLVSGVHYAEGVDIDLERDGSGPYRGSSLHIVLHARYGDRPIRLHSLEAYSYEPIH